MSVRQLRVALVLMLPCAAPAVAQELDPGAYWALPAGLNIVSAIATLNTGDVSFDPSLPVDDATAQIGNGVFVYTRALDLAGRSANLAVQVPVLVGHVEGRLRGEPASANRAGLSDPRIRLAVNLYGAPAMTPGEFASYRLSTVVGASVTVVPPLGHYDAAYAFNVGANRWSLKPELGVSHAIGRWVVDAMLGAWFFTDNSSFLVHSTRSQTPILSSQFHMTYRFRQNLWLAGDMNFYVGGRTSVDGEPNTDRFLNSRVGSTFSAGLNRRSAIRASVSFGALTTLGGDFASVGVGYSYAW